jgi:hypothetical protein
MAPASHVRQRQRGVAAAGAGARPRDKRGITNGKNCVMFPLAPKAAKLNIRGVRHPLRFRPAAGTLTLYGITNHARRGFRG